MKSNLDLIREEAESSLVSFIKLVHPMRLLGSVHEELIEWWCRPEAKSHQLVLLPRDHAKSAMVAYRVAWEITKNPAIRVLYISSTANLAIKQLSFIKGILASKQYRKYWPLMVNEDEGKRKKWTESEIIVDHPLREVEAIRDPTIFTAGLTTGIVGMHCDIAVLDDVVVNDNAYTKEGREKVRGQYSLLSSIEAGDAREWIVGTRYDPNDLYNDLQSMKVEIFGKDGELLNETDLYEVFEKKVEDRGDGTGEYLWPRQQRHDGKWFGFDQNILARKKAQYGLNIIQYYAQYYNNPNASGESTIDRSSFQYYERRNLHQDEVGDWRFLGKKLKVYAAIDFAYSLSSKADYTALVVVGIDSEHNYYILEIDRFKTTKMSVYYEHILNAFSKWGFRKIRAEVSVAQKVIVDSLRTDYIKRNGIPLSIDEYRPTRAEGAKEERINAILEPRYSNMSIWHYKGGNCQSLEEELIMARPPHDDIKDALANAISIAKAPIRTYMMEQKKVTKINCHPRFGGVV